MKVMTEETFAAIMPIMSFATVEQAVRLANDTIYGLSAAVFAGSTAEALLIGDRIEAGAISINESALIALIHEGEKNAFHFSGTGWHCHVEVIARFLGELSDESKIGKTFR